jgi:hypothetical protein
MIFVSTKANLITWYQRHERYLSAAALLSGFIIDNLTLTRIDLLFDNLILLSYLLLAVIGIVVFNLIDTGKLRGRVFERVAPMFPLLAQFAFGGLFSGYFIFYGRSASVLSSWIFVLILALFLVGNERFKKQYLRFRFQMSIFFVALFSFSIFSIPTLIGAIGPHIFVLSGVVSVGVMALLLRFLQKIMPEKIAATRNSLVTSISGIFIIFNILYFSNAIPPLPLSLKDIGVYHNIERVESGYRVLAESPPWYKFYRGYRNSFSRTEDEAVYVFSSVFAPTKLETKIFHQWQYFDDSLGRWTPAGTFGFPIIGGRDGGYRGFSTKTAIFEGKWRVNVITEHGQIVGRIKFEVEKSEEPVKFGEKIL